MVVQEHANRVLAAWLAGDADCLRNEMSLALSNRERSSELILEQEQKDLLDSVISDLWAAFVGKHPSSIARIQSSFALLQHLATRYDASFEAARAA